MDRRKIVWWLFLAFSFSIPLSQTLSIRILIGACVAALATGQWREIQRQYTRYGWEIALYFVVLAVGLLYSEDISSGLRTLETSSSLLLMPLVVGAVGVTENNRKDNVVLAFGAGLLTASLIYVIHALFDYAQTGSYEVFFSYKLTEILDFHPTYVAYYLIFMITVVLYRSYYDELRYPLWTGMSVVFLYFGVLMLTGGRTAFVSLLLVFSFFGLKYIVDQHASRQRVVLISVVIMLLSMFLVSYLASIGRWSDESDYWERLPLWRSALAANDNPLFGVGTGDEKDALNRYYVDHQLDKFASESYNSHNQFIQIWLSNGLVGLVATLLLLFRPLYDASRSGNIISILIFFPFLIYGMTEVFLGRYQAVVFIALIHQLFATNTDPYPITRSTSAVITP